MTVTVATYYFNDFKIALTVLSFLSASITILKFNLIGICTFLAIVFWSLIEVLALSYWLIIKPLNISLTIENQILGLVNFEHKLTTVISLFSSPLTIIIMLTPLLKPLIKYYVKIVEHICEREEWRCESWNITKHKTILAISVITTIFCTLYPYLPSINPYNVSIGVDARYYVIEVEKVSKDISYIFKGYIYGSRPLILLLIYYISKISNMTITDTVKYMPLIINILLTLATYIMVVKASGNREWAATSSLFTPIGIILSANMYAYILANTMAIALLQISIGYLIEALNKRRITSFITSTVFAITALLTHPWVFTQYYISTTLMIIPITITLIRTGKTNIKQNFIQIAIILAYLTPNLILSIFKRTALSSLDLTLLATQILNQLIKTITNPILTIQTAINFWRDSIMAFSIYYGGCISNTYLMLLALIGAIQIIFQPENCMETRLRDFITCLLTATLIAYPIVYDHAKLRLILGIPVSIFAAKGYLKITKTKKLNGKLKTSIIISTPITLINYTLRTLANLI
ncbi:hypothetical protein KEJ48_02875 [Candidatus Bathyarchaeota archaeon]|nr:hypothetical protein [Candidatus Bathyarchaeota archaeon]MBS7618800.1 hypothetical protein [Candidatus Bathyarchaeota archaeon]